MAIHYPAPDSKTQKILDKIQKHYEDLDRQVTPEALQQTSHKIKAWLARHNTERTYVSKHHFDLFNGNRQPAPVSDAVAKLRKELAQSQNIEMPPLKGRIKSYTN